MGIRYEQDPCGFALEGVVNINHRELKGNVGLKVFDGRGEATSEKKGFQ
jgi:hypothetical protein